MSRSFWSVAGVVGVATLLAPYATVAAQAFEGTISMRLMAPGREGPRAQMVEYMARGGKVRVTVASPMGEVAMIAAPADQKAYVVIDAQRTYLEMPLPATPVATPASPTVSPKAAPPAATGARKAGAVDTVAGYPCTHQPLTVPDARGAPQRLDACVSAALGPYVNPLAAVRGMMGGRASGWQDALAGVGGFPLKVTTDDGTVVLEVTAIAKRRVSASLFAVPADYVLQPLPKRPPG